MTYVTSAPGVPYVTREARGRAPRPAGTPRGLNRLYVVLTRAVSRLDVVHARALPW
ncbi:hypothetical protein [Streptomyces griseoruber]|uniref:hypothetical protein n=1 Tax=Streptomyces griseoruber TaxID=1943 RepID=UPI000B1D8755|nr:hypothetical protein [Streptomyces griseoruber]